MASDQQLNSTTAGGSHVFLYPGQGSQSVGMGRDLVRAFPEAEDLLARADRALGFPLSRICFEGPAEELDRDVNAQLAVYTLGCAVTDVLGKRGIRPDRVSGYSSGFYAAAYAAGCFDFETGLKTVRRAGELLLEVSARNPGGMGVVFGLSASRVEEIARTAGGAEVAILNTPRQLVISGGAEPLRRALDTARRDGALDAYPLPAAAAYHSSLMKEASRRFPEEIPAEGFQDPQIPLVSYLTLEPAADGEAVRRVMAEQLSRPVRWVDLVRGLSRDGALFFEAGPGAVLHRTVRWIDRRVEMLRLDGKREVEAALARFAGKRG